MQHHAAGLLNDGDVVLMDGGCSVEGYQSEHHAHVCFGKPTQLQREHLNLERKSQDAGFARGARKVGAPCEVVDAAARKVIPTPALGRITKFPVCRIALATHRVDGHEWNEFVAGNKTPIQPACAS